MSCDKKVKLKKLSCTLICGILAFLCDYIFILPHMAESGHTHILNVLDDWGWYASVVPQILVLALVMHLVGIDEARDWKYFLCFAGIQLLMVPVLYWYVTKFDGAASDVLTWVICAGAILGRVIMVVAVEWIILFFVSMPRKDEEDP